MKLAIIRQKYNPFGGAERFVSRALQALGMQHVRLSVLTRSWRVPDAMSQVQKVELNPFYAGSVWREWSFARAVQRYLRMHSQDFDLVQSHERIAGCDIYRAGDGVHAEWLKQRQRQLGVWRKLCLWANPFHVYMLQAERKMFLHPKLKAVICNSKMVQAEIQQYFGLPLHQLPLVYSGVDLEVYHPVLQTRYRQTMREQLTIPQDATVALLVGSGFARKGVPQLLSALQQLPGSVCAVIVGADKKRVAYERQLASMGLTQRVRFVGGQEDTLPYYGMADIFVLPTLYDPFPNVVLEALASGLPVITSTKSGAAEFIKSGYNGEVVDALDVEQLKQALMVLCTETRHLRQTAARQSVEPYSLSAMAQQLTLLYQTILKEEK